jgi:hypothetical protein
MQGKSVWLLELRKSIEYWPKKKKKPTIEGFSWVVVKGLFGSAISVSTILKIAFLKSSLFKIIQAFGKTC